MSPYSPSTHRTNSHSYSPPFAASGAVVAALVSLATLLVLVMTLRPMLKLPLIEAGGAASRLQRPPWWQRLLFAPNGVNYHMEHHFMASVPCYRLAALREHPGHISVLLALAEDPGTELTVRTDYARGSGKQMTVLADWIRALRD